MSIGRTTLTIAAASLFAIHAASAQTIDCACSGDFEVGDRVRLLVSNPGPLSGLPAGTIGTVICGRTPPGVGLDLLVRWDNWTNGSAGAVNVCDCPVAPGGGTTSDGTVACTAVELFTPVTNITQGTDHFTIAEGVTEAVAGDVLELDAYTFVEQDILLNNKDITIRGQGPGLTIVDGNNVAGSIFQFRNGDESTIEGLTLRNGFEPDDNGGGAADLLGGATSVTFLNCRFESNDGGTAPAGAVYLQQGSIFFERCVFSDTTGSHIVAIAGASVSAIQCLFADSTPSQNAIRLQDAGMPVSGLFVNCTFANVTGQRHIRILGPGSTGEIINCVFDDSASGSAFAATTDATLITNSRNVYPGATGDNIDGIPTFVDGANGDFRLASGSLGIDAANADAYLDEGGMSLDLAGAFRYSDDTGTFNTGVGPTSILDSGAYEFQGNSPAQGQCPGDLDSDGDTDLGDFTILASDFGCAPSP
ncbi:MAG: hypothetical protein AAFX05_02900 [Planctomycetota bacterium]